jgi:hypothetical protein
MSHLSVGERVELKSCTGIPGTVTGFVRGRVEVLFDDCRHEPARLFRPESLQRTSVPKPVAFGTRSGHAAGIVESGVYARGSTDPSGTRSARGTE